MLNLHFTPAEKRAYFERLGFKIVKSKFGHFEKLTHGPEEWIENEADAVAVEYLNGEYKCIELDAAFDTVVLTKLKNLVIDGTKHIDVRLALVDFARANRLKVNQYDF